MARDNGAATIGISNYVQSPLHDSSTFFFCTSFPESHVKVSALSSRIAQMCLVDVIYLLCARCRGPSGNVDNLDRHLEDLLRFPEKR
jgi:DNA-binding MurR/RpiR family transcriptional regulator